TQGGRGRSRRLDRRGDCGTFGNDADDGPAGPPAVRRRRAGCHPAPEEADRAAVPQARRPPRGPISRAGLLAGPGGPDPLDDETAGRPAGGVGSSRVDQPGDRVADAEKNDLKPWLVQQWVIPPKASAGFVANMEDVLDTYAKPYEPARPVVCV